jgi:hypothetical protein
MKKIELDGRLVGYRIREGQLPRITIEGMYEYADISLNVTSIWLEDRAKGLAIGGRAKVTIELEEAGDA